MLSVSCISRLFSTQFKSINPLIRALSNIPIIAEKRGNILLITINRPEKRNCINNESAKLLLDAFKELDSNDDIKIGILSGKGGNFCSGYDLSELAGISDEQKLIRPAPMGPSHLITKKPLIAAIDGYAVAGGLELALLADLRVIEDTAILGVFNRRFGVPLIDGGTVRLPKIIGLGRALDLILTGRAIDGKEALNIGLATLTCSTGCCLGMSMNLAASITKFNQECLRIDRDSVYHSVFDDHSMKNALDYEYENGKKIISSVSVDGAKLFVNEKLGKHGKFGFDSLDGLMDEGKKGKSKLLDE